MSRAPLFLLLPLMLVALPAAAAPSAGLHLDLGGSDGGHLSIELPLSMIGDFFPGAHADLRCNPDADSESRGMIADLERQGERGSYRFVEDDGVAVARRHGEVFTLDKTSKDGSTAHFEIPWVLARCFLGGEPVHAKVRDLLGQGKRVRVKINGAEGGEFRLAVE